MAQCPVCQADIVITTHHHGTLFTCPHCSAVFYVDWSGQPEAPATEEIPQQYQETPSSEYHQTTNTPVFSSIPEEEPPVENQYGGPVPDDFAAPHEQAPIPHEQILEELPTEESLPQEETPYDFSAPLGTPEPMTPLTPEAPILEDITDFGNADLSNAAFNYTITISGIDSGALRKQIEEAVNDAKFGWNVIQVMAQIKGGVLTIKSVNAVKASILIQRVKYLPVKISWRQDVLSGSV